MNPWRRVICLSDCTQTEDEDFICPVCQEEYSQCPCPGPHQDDLYEYKEEDGALYARELPE